MEDYYGAFLERSLDTDLLLNGNRTVGTVHMGAIAIECLIKSIIVERHSLDGWGINVDGTAHGITNPGHELIEGIHKIPEIRRRIPAKMLTYFEVLQQPRIHYIDMRYNVEELSEEHIMKWNEAYKRVRYWLISQRTLIVSRKRR